MFNKRAFITHPVTLAFIAFLIGMLLMYLMAKGIIPTPLSGTFCPIKK